LAHRRFDDPQPGLDRANLHLDGPAVVALALAEGA